MKTCVCKVKNHSPETCNPHCGCLRCWDTWADMERIMYQVKHPLACKCGQNLTIAGSVKVCLSLADQQLTVLSNVDRDGELIDRDDFVAHGHHAGSYCYNCGELIDELD